MRRPMARVLTGDVVDRVDDLLGELVHTADTKRRAPPGAPVLPHPCGGRMAAAYWD